MDPKRKELIGRLEEILQFSQSKTASHDGGTSIKYSEARLQYSCADMFDSEDKLDWLNRCKEVVKRKFGKIYPSLISLISPVLFTGSVEKFLSKFDLKTDLVFDFGSGTTVHSEQVICVDGFNYDNVHLVSDLRSLPIKSESISGIISLAVLEHVPDPKEHVAEMYRLLKPGGMVYCFVPFMQPFHASPFDYQRLTVKGLERLFSDFEINTIEVAAGPTSGLIWNLQEWFALVLSLGSVKLYKCLIPLLWILSPLKVIDYILVKHPCAQVSASGFSIIATKPTGNRDATS